MRVPDAHLLVAFSAHTCRSPGGTPLRKPAPRPAGFGLPLHAAAAAATSSEAGVAVAGATAMGAGAGLAGNEFLFAQLYKRFKRSPRCVVVGGKLRRPLKTKK